MRISLLRVAWTAALAGLISLVLPRTSEACTICFGDPNSPMAIGTSWGILFLLCVTFGMLGAFAYFFLYLVRRSRLALGEQSETGSTQAPGSV
ncbi:MAG: hypothetical protein CL441_06415 [Acidimicrobiaceae bacterium]|nr:hypothetical protein [Acidimicrobiaceae bacterium]|tara:strand:+ start:1364 stop:1642 length:279 start_codon:yes stop_codon:yes gene_type:complete